MAQNGVNNQDEAEQGGWPTFAAMHADEGWVR